MHPELLKRTVQACRDYMAAGDCHGEAPPIERLIDAVAQLAGTAMNDENTCEREGEWRPSMEGAPPTAAIWTSPHGIEYRKHEGRWSRYITPGHWNGSMTLTPLDDEILDALIAAIHKESCEMKPQVEADNLRAEAKIRLHEQFCIMGRNDRDAVDRIVDCIIGAARL